MSRKDGQKTFSVDDTAARIRRDAIGDEIGYAVETAVQAERKRLVAMLRAESDVEMQGHRWGWYDMAMRLRKWADALESTGTL